MTLFDLAKKNIKGNLKNYLVYFVSMLFCVMTYYTFVSLQYSTEIAKSIESSKSMQSIFLVASLVLILFVTIFILYSNNFFARKRKKEVGLYSLLGLPKKTIAKMLFYENLIMGALVCVTGIAIGTFLSKLFTMILFKLLGTAVETGMTFSFQAILNTVIVFAVIILFTSLQSYRLIYRFQLIELFRAEQEGEQEPRASLISALLAVLCLGTGYWFAFQNFATSEEILLNLGIMAVGIILGTLLLFTSLVILLLKLAKRNKKSYYWGMNLVSTSNLVYRIKGNARTLAVISLLSAVALCAFSVGFGMYYAFEKTARLTSPFSYMHIAQDESFNRSVEGIVSGDKEHPVTTKMSIPVLKIKGEASTSEILSEREYRADENPLKVIALGEYNRVAHALGVPSLGPVDSEEVIAIRPMYTDKEFADYEGETITLRLPKENLTLGFAGMTVERIINWSYPDIMIVVNDSTYQRIEAQVSPTTFVGYLVQEQETTKETADALATIKTPESQLSTFYSEYRLGKEGAAFNIFILGFLGLIFVMATGSIIYFKQLTEAAADKTRYDILKKIGVSKKEINRSILVQNAFIFILPLMVGLAHYIVILNLLTRLFSNLAGASIILPILVCTVTFVSIYAVYYVMTVNSISKMVNGESTPALKIATMGIGIFMSVSLGIFLWSETPAPQEGIYTGEKTQLILPKPTGEYSIGTTELHLVDPLRMDPWVKGKTRELMISIWYPAKEESEKKALYMPSGAAKHYDENTIPTIGLDPGRIDLSGIDTNAWLGAPVAEHAGGWPVILYSPGGSIPRNFGTVLVEELVSQGYVVVTVDHTYETSEVEFPNGRVETEKLPEFGPETILKMLDVRVDDLRYVLDQLALLQKGNNPDYEQRALSEGLGQALDLSKVGIFGHSAGGATAAQTMYEDNRVDAGIDMDGTLGYMPDYPLPVAQHGLDRPFMLMNSGYNKEGEVDSHLTAQDRDSFWQNSTGWKLDLAIPKGAHFTFTDYQALLPSLDRKLSLSSQVIQQSIGKANPDQVIAAQRNYVGAFFNLHLKGMPQPILEKSSPDYPEVELIKD